MDGNFHSWETTFNGIKLRVVGKYTQELGLCIYEVYVPAGGNVIELFQELNTEPADRWGELHQQIIEENHLG